MDEIRGYRLAEPCRCDVMKERILARAAAREDRLLNHARR
jgi:hypothetical protein